ncbi:MAG: ATP-binding cassette domain-containing protein [Bacteroidota bacterium]|nr:ATP-binding cassette domain-containing protein [Bacteroidota bacterium]
MITVKNIFKSFGDKPVLEDISYAFEPGKNNLIIGQSGSGKTVLMKCIIGLFHVDKGDVIYDERVFSGMKKKELKEVYREIGMLFQAGALYDYMTVEENVMFPLSMFTKDAYDKKLKRVNFCLERVNLKDSNKLMPSELSGGMVKRVAIARAISMNPKYLFCDEPNSGLDPKTAELIDDLINEITKEYKITTIVNTHDMNSVLNIGDNIAFIHQGQLWWQGTKKDILSTTNKELNEFVFSTELTRRLK